MVKRILLLFAATLPVVMAQTETYTFSYLGPPLPIEYSSSEWAVAEIPFPRALRISNVTVRVQIDYPQTGDLNVFLYSAQGTRSKLLERNCGALTNVDTTFDDAAQSAFSSFCPTEAGRGPFRSNEPLANSNNQVSLGIWRLAVQNNRSANGTGQLRSFSVTVTGTPEPTPTFIQETIVSSSSLRSGYIAPGELIGIFGSGLGPAEAARAPEGNLPTTLGGTTVIMDGVAVPIGYASNRLVLVQVPYAEIPGTQARIQISYNGKSSAVVSIPVRTAAPGIYTTGEGGHQAKAVNENGQLNSKENPAAKGSQVYFYASGLGITDPTLPAGIAAPGNPLYYTVYPIAVYVGGFQAQVTFAGLAPGLNGIYQVNIVIPDEVAAGTHELTIVAVNGAVSQDKVYLDVE